ncbi:MAG: contact-dependent growth inhibition system immunity protein [Mucilaginibacter sp.]
MENNWRYQSLQNLEKDDWGTPAYPSHLVKRCHELRKVPLNEFTIEDLRIMIGQAIGLTYLIPIALEKLQENILAEGDLYPGDLLKSVINIDSHFWATNKELYAQLKQLIVDNRGLIESENISLLAL